MNYSIRKYKIRRLQRRLDRLFRKDEDRLPKDQIEWITANKKHIPVKKGNGEGVGPVKGKNFSQAESKPISELQREERAKETELTPEQKKRNKAYRKALDSGDMDTARKLVEEAAKQAGYTIEAYHGTKGDFTEFSKKTYGKNYNGWSYLGGGFYFAPYEDSAERWAEESKQSGKPKVLHVYLKSNRMKHADDPIDEDKAVDALRSVGIPESEIGQYTDTTANLINELQAKGYTPQDVQDLFKEMGYDGIYDGRQYVVFDPDQIRLSDAIVRDESGDVIPLSERFQAHGADIRGRGNISNEEKREPYTLEKSIKKLLSEKGSMSPEEQLEESKRIIGSMKLGDTFPMIYHQRHVTRGFTVERTLDGFSVSWNDGNNQIYDYDRFIRLFSSHILKNGEYGSL